MKNKFLYILLLLSSTILFGQQKRVSIAVDSTKVKMGAQINVTLKTTVDTLSKVTFPDGKLFGALEVLESYPVDTIKENSRYQLIKKYGITQFDTGKYTLPSLKVIINDKPFYTDSIKLEIASVKVDTLKQKLYDIKDIIAAENPVGNWWKYLLGILILVGLMALGYYLYKNRQAKPIEVEEEIFESPIEKATTHLKSLEQKDLISKGNIKEYYSELTDIARTYIEEVLAIPAMESTTDELILSFKNAIKRKKLPLSEETASNLLGVLKQADLVKFAKSKPLDFEIVEDKTKIEKTIYKIHQSIPDKVEDDEDEDFSIENETTRLEALQKKKRKKNIIATVSIVGFLLICVTTFFVVTKGIDFLKVNLIGHPTKELLEGEWISSEYGYPAIRLETPKVLKRQDLNSKLPKEALAMIKSTSFFTSGEYFDSFFVGLTTIQYKDSIQLDIQKGVEGSLAEFEKRGGKILTAKQEDYNAENGVQGKRVFGTLVNKTGVGSNLKEMYYELIMYVQKNSMQQLMIIHEDQDDYAEQITERIKNSMELGKAN